MGAGFAAGLKVVGAFLVAKGTVAQLVRMVLVNVILGALARSRARRSAGTPPPVNVTIRNTIENRRLVFGRTRCGGAIVFFGASGEDNEYLHYVVVFAGHQCNAIRDVWIDKIRVLEDQIDGGGAVTSGPLAGVCWITKYLGTQAQTADSALVAAFPGTWSSSHRLRGVTYIHVKMLRDQDKWPQGAPQNITAIIEGALCYDPRKDSTNGGSGSHRRDNPSTWEFTRNPALHARHYISGGSVVNDQATRLIRYGFREADSRIDDPYFAAAANVNDTQLTGAYVTPDGDQVTWNNDLEVSTGETRREILEAILQSMAGHAVYPHGKWRVYAGGYDTPLHTITQDDLYTLEEAPIEIQDTTDDQDRYNAVAGVFIDEANDYIQQTTPFRTYSTYQDQDGGEFIPKEIVLRGCVDKYRAQRLCEIELRKSRQMRIINIRGALNLLKIAPGETFQLSHTTFGWTNRVFRNIERQLEFTAEAGRVVCTAKSDAASVYVPIETADYITPNTVATIRQVERPAAPSAPVTVPQTDAVLFRWTRSSTQGVLYEVEASTNSDMSGATTVYDGTDNQAYIDRTSTTTYYFRVRSKKHGEYSDWVPSGGGVAGAALGVSATLTASASPGSASSSGTGASQTTGSVTVTPNGGTSPYTYAWTWASGGSGITITSPTAAATTFSATTLADPESRSGVARCTVTDSAAQTYIVDVPVSIVRTPSFTATAAGTSPIVKTANATTITSNNITATPSGGTAPYTYAWSIVAEDDPDGTPTLLNGTSQSCQVRTSQDPSDQIYISVTVQCVVTDNISRTATTNTVTVSHGHNDGS